MRARTPPPRPPAGPPATVEEGEARVRAALIKLFDRNDGTGADWKLMLGSLYRAGFKIADDQLGDDVRRKLMARVHEEAELRMTGGYADGSGSGDTKAAATDSTLSNAGALAAPHPKGPR